MPWGGFIWIKDISGVLKLMTSFMNVFLPVDTFHFKSRFNQLIELFAGYFVVVSEKRKKKIIQEIL